MSNAIPASILSKLSTEEGVAELKSLIEDNKVFGELKNIDVYRGGGTHNVLSRKENTIARLTGEENCIAIELSIPSENGGARISIVHVKIGKNEFIRLQKAMTYVLMNNLTD